MTSINEEQLYEKRIAFYRDRTQTCGYRFYDMIQTRRKEMQRLAEHYDNEGAQQQAQTKVLGSVDTYVNCLDGNYNSKELPDYIQAEADAFKTIFYTRLAPKYVLEVERQKLVEKVFNHNEGL